MIKYLILTDACFLFLTLFVHTGNYTEIILDGNKLTNFQSSVFQSTLNSIAGYNNSYTFNYASISASKGKKSKSLFFHLFRCH